MDADVPDWNKKNEMEKTFLLRQTVREFRRNWSEHFAANTTFLKLISVTENLRKRFCSAKSRIEANQN